MWEVMWLGDGIKEREGFWSSAPPRTREEEWRRALLTHLRGLRSKPLERVRVGNNAWGLEVEACQWECGIVCWLQQPTLICLPCSKGESIFL